MNSRPSWVDEYETLLSDCEEREERLTDWERTFVDSIRKWIENGKRPTDKQSAQLDSIWERATKKG